MAKVFQLRRGIRTENDQFTGVEGEIVAVIDQTNTSDTTIRLHDDIKLGGFEVARADLLNTGNGAVTIIDFATSISQQPGTENTIIRYDSFGVGQFIFDFPGDQITPGTLNVSTLVGPANLFMTFDGAGLVIGQPTIANIDIEDESVVDYNIPDNEIQTVKIADLSVGTPNFGYLVIDSDKLTDISITEAKIENGSVITSKIADLNITPATHFALNSVTNAKFASNAITEDALENNTILKENVDANSAGNAHGERHIDTVAPLDVNGNDEDLFYQV